MKKLFIQILAVSCIASIATAADEKDDREGGDRRGGDRQQRGGGQQSQRSNPLFAAIDTDKDGVLSAAEVKNAPAALKKLDKNKDGKITQEELRPSTDEIVARFMGYDENKDGKLSKDEMPAQMQRMFDRLDTNSDGSLDEQELQALAASFGQRGGRRQRGGDRRDDGDK